MPPAGLQPPPGKLGHRQEGPPVGTPQGLYRGETAGRLRERRLHGRGQGEAAGLPGRGCSRPVTGFLGAGDMSRGESDMDTPTSDCGWRRGGGLRARSGPTGAPAGTGSSSRALRTSRRPHFRHFPGNSFHVGRIAHTASVRFDENRGRPAAATAAQARSVPRLRPGAHRRPQGRRLSPSTPPGAPARRACGIAREAWLLARAFCVRSVSRMAGGPAAGPRPERVHPAACRGRPESRSQRELCGARAEPRAPRT